MLPFVQLSPLSPALLARACPSAPCRVTHPVPASTVWSLQINEPDELWDYDNLVKSVKVHCCPSDLPCLLCSAVSLLELCRVQHCINGPRASSPERLAACRMSFRRRRMP